MRFTISEVAADWYKLMIPRRTMRQRTIRAVVQPADTPLPQSVTLSTARKLQLVSHAAEGRRLS